MAGKFYWLKLKEDFFQQEAIEWLEEQENGKEYSLLYLKLCLKSLKDNGVLVRRIGTKNIPYSVEKIADITNTDLAVVEKGIETLKEIGLLTEDEEHIFTIPDLAKMVGCESGEREAIKKRAQRLRKKMQEGDNLSPTLSPLCPQNVPDVSTSMSTNVSSQKGTHCPTEIRDKRLEIRDKNISLSFSPSCHGVTQNIVQLYEQKIGLLNARNAERLADLLEHYGERRVIEGIKTAYDRGARTIGYVAKCVENPLPERPPRVEMPF